VADMQTWHLRLSLAPQSQPGEVFFTLTATLEDSILTLGDAMSGFACCNQYKYYAFQGVSEHVAPAVYFNLTSGRIKALYWRYDSCPVEEEDVVSGNCLSWCALDWYRRYSGNLGLPRYERSSTLTVPYGVGEAPDKRRGGRWYLGIQALDIAAEYTAITAEQAPPPLVDTGCSRFSRYCPTNPRTERYRNMGASESSGRRQTDGRLLRSVGWLLAVLSSGALLSCPSESPSFPPCQGEARSPTGRSRWSRDSESKLV